MSTRHSPIRRSRRVRFEHLENRNMMAYLPGDFDLSTVVDEADFLLWRSNFGAVGESPIDGNGNGVVDAADYTVWRDNLGKTLADVAPDGPRGVEARAVGSTSIEVDWQAADFATSYTVLRRRPDSESVFTSIASGVTASVFTDNTVATNTLYEYAVVAQNTNGPSQPSQIAHAIAGRANLTAYRPQSVHALVDPEDAPIYAPFPKTAVHEDNESHSALGPGIRINRDDDNGDGQFDSVQTGIEIARENDLIEVKVDRLPGQGDMLLRPSSSLTLYYDYDKETPIPLDNDLIYTEPLLFDGNTITVFVEWDTPFHGTDVLQLVDASTVTTQDSLRFHTFRSLVIVFGGRTQNPADTDGDGSIGDPIGDSTTNREGIYDLAQVMYNAGYDVLAFDEDDVDEPEAIPLTEARNAIEKRFVGQEYGGGVSIMGYSQGGGAAHDLIESLYDDGEGYTTLYGVYLDAVTHDGFGEENDWPNAVYYLLNIYQDVEFLSGGEVNNVEPPGILEEYNTTVDDGWDHTLNHSSIDDNLVVLQFIAIRLEQVLAR